jgi:hypothetical protein
MGGPPGRRKRGMSMMSLGVLAVPLAIFALEVARLADG